MKKFFLLGFLLVLSLPVIWLKAEPELLKKTEIVSPAAPQKDTPKVLDRYSFDSLSKRLFLGNQIKLEKVMKEEAKFTSYLFSYKADGKKVTGQLNIPKGEGRFPVIVMVRGYVDDYAYFTGAGTHKAAAVFAENGFITLAPDFLGFGGSDTSSADILEARFEKPIAVLELLESIKTLPQADSERVALWAHSNGGQITLSVLEITRKPLPTTLWAPVTLGFPDSVLSFMGEMDDQGLKVKTAIGNFMKDYDPKRYSVNHYFGDIKAPIQLHQGTWDAMVREEWSDDFASKMKALGKEITYYKYPKNDHNLKQSWDLVVQRDLEFFKSRN